GARGGSAPAPDAAPDPDLVRRPEQARAAPDRPPRRRLVPLLPVLLRGAGARRPRGDRRRRARRPPRPRADRDGGRDLLRRPALRAPARREAPAAGLRRLRRLRALVEEVRGDAFLGHLAVGRPRPRGDGRAHAGQEVERHRDAAPGARRLQEGALVAGNLIAAKKPASPPTRKSPRPR